MLKYKSIITSIDVDGLPEQVVEALHVLVNFLRKQNKKQAQPIVNYHGGLLQKNSDVIGPITREEIYEDVG